MPSLNYNIAIQVDSGLQLSGSRPKDAKDVQAFDRVRVTVDPGNPGAPEVAADLQPSVAGRVVLLFIQSTVYGDQLSYRLSDGGGTDSQVVTLNEPQLFLGAAVTLFGVANPRVLKLKNEFPSADASKKAVVDVFVARSAT